MRVLFDTNVVLDVLLARPSHVALSARLFNLVDRKVIEGFLCATTITTIHYLAEKAVGPKKARKHVADLLAMFSIAQVDNAVLRRALDLKFSDYEDGVLHEAARGCAVDAIVTRNTQDFQRASIPIFDPQRLLATVSLALGDGPSF